jgi:hypothetical protein
LPAGVTFLVGGTVAATLASRVVITETARSTSENAS